MKLNQFAVYRVDQQTAGKALWHLPYQEARQQNVSITVENYRLISIHEMQENEKVADIWKRTKNQCEPKKRRSVIKRLHQKQIAIARRSGKPIPKYLDQEMERKRG